MYKTHQNVACEIKMFRRVLLYELSRWIIFEFIRILTYVFWNKILPIFVSAHIFTFFLILCHIAKQIYHKMYKSYIGILSKRKEKHYLRYLCEYFPLIKRTRLSIARPVLWRPYDMLKVSTSYIKVVYDSHCLHIKVNMLHHFWLRFVSTPLKVKLSLEILCLQQKRTNSLKKA